MLALLAGTGDLPPALIARLKERPMICALHGFEPKVTPDLTFRLEHLASFIQTLQQKGVHEICFAGAVRRPPVDPAQIDAATMPLVPRIMAALQSGDDGALRAIIAIFEEAGLAVRAAHDIAPDLLPPAGVLGQHVPNDVVHGLAQLAEDTIGVMGAADLGQACIFKGGAVIAREGPDGTDAMLTALRPEDAAGAVLFKAPKPQQDRRADLPVIGVQTAHNAVWLGLSGIVVEAGGVMVLDLTDVLATLDAAGLFFWVRPKGGK